MLGHTPSNITFDRIKSSLLNPILEALTSADIVNEAKEPPQKRMRITAPDYSYLSVHACIEPTNSPESPEAIKMSLLKAVFSNASHGDTRESNRRKLYAIWKAGMLEYEQAQILSRGE
jgi:ribosomal RNA-processing protein 1